jgi:pSer/pThr/pTyr-binding forkhead associated (FHA) protein
MTKLSYEKNGKKQEFPITQDIMIIGRSRSCDLRVNDGHISAKHCQISRIGENFVLHDLSSKNGTCINGNKVTEGILQNGDEIKIGDTSIRFEQTPA